MKIQLLIRRKAGSTTEVGGVKYHFNDANNHTADVENEDHARFLLNLDPVYVPAPADAETQTAAPADSAAPDGDAPIAAPKAPRKPRAPKAPKA